MKESNCPAFKEKSDAFPLDNRLECVYKKRIINCSNMNNTTAGVYTSADA